jgi:hypothetical protein
MAPTTPGVVAIAVAARDALDAPDALADPPPPPRARGCRDATFGSATECAADAIFVKRASLIVVPVVLLLCMLTLLLSRAT